MNEIEMNAIYALNRNDVVWSYLVAHYTKSVVLSFDDCSNQHVYQVTVWISNWNDDGYFDFESVLIVVYFYCDFGCATIDYGFVWTMNSLWNDLLMSSKLFAIVVCFSLVSLLTTL
jgi:hypothetical protein